MLHTCTHVLVHQNKFLVTNLLDVKSVVSMTIELLCMTLYANMYSNINRKQSNIRVHFILFFLKFCKEKYIRIKKME